MATRNLSSFKYLAKTVRALCADNGMRYDGSLQIPVGKGLKADAAAKLLSPAEREAFAAPDEEVHEQLNAKYGARTLRQLDDLLNGIFEGEIA